MPAVNPDVSQFKGPRGELKLRCGHCNITGSKATLSSCMGCRVVRYCCREHQVADRPIHKNLCNKVKKSRPKVAQEDDRIRNNPHPGFMAPANAFESHVGHFWGLLDTRDYMRARFFLADELRRIGTLEGVQEALDHFKDMLRLCRSDNMGVRDLVPALMLQLDQDQECYDFIKWYQTEGQRSDYDWGDMDLPFLNFKDADVFEATGFMDQGKFGDAHHCAALILLKLKLLNDVINIRLARRVCINKLPTELSEMCELAVIRSPLSASFAKKSSIDLVAAEGLLVGQIRYLGSYLREENDNVITGLLYPDEWLVDIPETMTMGSTNEMQILLQHSFPAWWQIEGALELLRASTKIASLDSESEIDDMMRSSTFKREQGSGRTREELLRDVSLNRIWGYIDDAVRDAGSLAAERPSEVRRRETRAMLAELSDDEDDLSDD